MSLGSTPSWNGTLRSGRAPGTWAMRSRPGNARQLENTMERVVALTRSARIEVEDRPAHPVSEARGLRCRAAAAARQGTTVPDEPRRAPPASS